MTSRLWFIYLGIFLVCSALDAIGHATISVGDPSDINNASTFNADELATGGGFSAILRATPGFIVTTLPKFVTWNYGFLTGDFQMLQYIGITLFGGMLVITYWGDAIQLIRRVF